MVTDRDIMIKKHDPRVILHRISDAIKHYLSANATQLTHKVGGGAEASFSNVKTKKFLIGAYGVAGCDFNFPNDANMTENIKDLGEVIPAFARFLDAKTITEVAFNPASTLVAETGTTSSGGDIIASATIKALDAITQVALAGAPLLAVSAAHTHVFVSATPGSNWSTITAGRLAVYVTYIEI